MTRKIREERSVNMSNYEGKHEKQEINFSWNPMPDEWYKARIKTLEKENRDLSREVEALEHREQMLQGCIMELKSDIEELIERNRKLEAVVLKAALKEVE